MKKRPLDKLSCIWKLSETPVDHLYTLPDIRCLLPNGMLTILHIGRDNAYDSSQMASMYHAVTAINVFEYVIAIGCGAYSDAKFRVHSPNYYLIFLTLA